MIWFELSSVRTSCLAVIFFLSVLGQGAAGACPVAQSQKMDVAQFHALMSNYLGPFQAAAKEWRPSPGSFNGPFVISLEKDTHRFEGTKFRLSKLGLDAVRFPAYNPVAQKTKDVYPSVYNFLLLDDFDASHKETGMGCTLSHLLIYYYISHYRTDNAYTMIFEDDISYYEDELNSSVFLGKIEKAISYNKDIIYMGKCYEFCEHITPIEDDLFTAVRPLCLHAYLIKNTFAKQIIDYILRIPHRAMEPVDWLPAKVTDTVECKSCKYINKKSHFIGYHPSLFEQDTGYESNLRKSSERGSIYECVKYWPWQYWGHFPSHVFIDKRDETSH